MNDELTDIFQLGHSVRSTLRSLFPALENPEQIVGRHFDLTEQ